MSTAEHTLAGEAALASKAERFGAGAAQELSLPKCLGTQCSPG
ncbi:MAG TPA: hypothetical protein VIM11_14905 [Tepidisphaeraceae bacterium]|jgi:hypothetical protein